MANPIWDYCRIDKLGRKMKHQKGEKNGVLPTYFWVLFQGVMKVEKGVKTKEYICTCGWEAMAVGYGWPIGLIVKWEVQRFC